MKKRESALNPLPLLEENVDYELIPTVRFDEANTENNEWGWYVRLLTGEFVETVIEFGTLRENEELQQLDFDFYVVSTPDPAITIADPKLQIHAADVLRSIVTNAVREHRQLFEEQGESELEE